MKRYVNVRCACGQKVRVFYEDKDGIYTKKCGCGKELFVKYHTESEYAARVYSGKLENIGKI